MIIRGALLINVGHTDALSWELMLSLRTVNNKQTIIMEIKIEIATELASLFHAQCFCHPLSASSLKIEICASKRMSV